MQINRKEYWREIDFLTRGNDPLVFLPKIYRTSIKNQMFNHIQWASLKSPPLAINSARLANTSGKSLGFISCCPS